MKATETTAVVIDGMALLALKGALGIRRINFRRLYSILTRIGGGQLLYGAPLMTLRPNIVENNGKGLGKVLGSMGYKVIPVPTEKGPDGISQDDQYLIDHLSKLEVKRVARVVLLGTDADLAAAFLEKVKAIAALRFEENAVRGYIVGTRTVEQGGTSSVGQSVETLFTEYPDLIEFVELAEHTKELEYAPVVYQLPAPTTEPPPEDVAEPSVEEQNGHGPNGNGAESDGLRVVIDLSETGVNTDLLNEIMALQRKFPGLAMHFN